MLGFLCPYIFHTFQELFMNANMNFGIDMLQYSMVIIQLSSLVSSFNLLHGVT